MAANNITSHEFKTLLTGDKPLLVDFWAPWCSYCRRIGPAYDKVAETWGDRVHVVKIDIDREPELAAAEGIEVIPTLVLYRGGTAAGSLVAPESRSAIEQLLQSRLS